MASSSGRAPFPRRRPGLIQGPVHRRRRDAGDHHRGHPQCFPGQRPGSTAPSRSTRSRPVSTRSAGSVRRGLRPAVVRLYDSTEAHHRFPSSVTDGTSVLLLIAEGDEAVATLTMAEAAREVGRSGMIELDATVGERWLAERTSTAGLCRVLATPDGVADALEVANVWSRLATTYHHMKEAMEAVVGSSGRVYGHASHFYPSGGNLYLIFEAHAAQPARSRRLSRTCWRRHSGPAGAEGGAVDRIITGWDARSRLGWGAVGSRGSSRMADHPARR